MIKSKRDSSLQTTTGNEAKHFMIIFMPPAMLLGILMIVSYYIERNAAYDNFFRQIDIDFEKSVSATLEG